MQVTEGGSLVIEMTKEVAKGPFVFVTLKEASFLWLSSCHWQITKERLSLFVRRQLRNVLLFSFPFSFVTCVSTPVNYRERRCVYEEQTHAV